MLNNKSDITASCLTPLATVKDSNRSFAHLTLYDPGGGGALKAPTPIFCSHAFNFGATLLCVGDFSQKIV